MFIFYTKPYKWLYGDKADGKHYFGLIFIKKQYKNDKCLLEHELVHRKQFLSGRSFFMSRCEREKEAYLKQYECAKKLREVNNAFFINRVADYCGIEDAIKTFTER